MQGVFRHASYDLLLDLGTYRRLLKARSIRKPALAPGAQCVRIAIWKRGCVIKLPTLLERHLQRSSVVHYDLGNYRPSVTLL